MTGERSLAYRARTLKRVADLRRFVLATCKVTLCSFSSWADDKQPSIVTFTLDDGSAGQFIYGLPSAEEYNIIGTIFIPTGSIGTGSWHMSWEQIRAFKVKGWEVGSHTVTHPDLTLLPLPDVENELELSAKEIEQNVGARPVSFSAPFGAFNNEVLHAIGERYHNNVLADSRSSGRNSLSNPDRLHIERLDVTNAMTSSDICSFVERSKEREEWLVLMIHEIVPDPTPGPFQMSNITWAEVMKCTAALREQGAIVVKTMKDAVPQRR